MTWTNWIKRFTLLHLTTSCSVWQPMLKCGCLIRRFSCPTAFSSHDVNCFLLPDKNQMITGCTKSQRVRRRRDVRMKRCLKPTDEHQAITIKLPQFYIKHHKTCWQTHNNYNLMGQIYRKVVGWRIDSNVKILWQCLWFRTTVHKRIL